MIAYNKSALYNLFVQKEAEEAFENNRISKEEYAAVNLKYSSGFYTPNFFICIGLFILTAVIIIFSLGVFSLGMVGLGSEKAITGLAIFFSAICFVALEYVVRRNHHYSGVDTALQFGAAMILFSGIAFGSEAHAQVLSVLTFIISLACTARYAHPVMAIITFLSLLAMFIFTFENVHVSAKVFLPFVLMMISVVVYFISKKINNKKEFTGYEACSFAVEITSLITFYAAGNYFIVKQLGDIMFNSVSAAPLPFGFLFWIFTIGIPVIYLFFGIKNKDAVLLRTGLLFVGAIIFTIRYYYSFMPAEIAMTIAGILMILIAWLLTRYLHISKSGFTSEEIIKKNIPGKAQLEALIIAQTFSQQGTVVHNKFGGGDFGGGGASGEF